MVFKNKPIISQEQLIRCSWMLLASLGKTGWQLKNGKFTSLSVGLFSRLKCGKKKTLKEMDPCSIMSEKPFDLMFSWKGRVSLCSLHPSTCSPFPSVCVSHPVLKYECNHAEMSNWEVSLCMNNHRFLHFLMLMYWSFNPERFSFHSDDTSALPAAKSFASQSHLKAPSKWT